MRKDSRSVIPRPSASNLMDELHRFARNEAVLVLSRRGRGNVARMKGESEEAFLGRAREQLRRRETEAETDQVVSEHETPVVPTDAELRRNTERQLQIIEQGFAALRKNSNGPVSPENEELRRLLAQRQFLQRSLHALEELNEAGAPLPINLAVPSPEPSSDAVPTFTLALRASIEYEKFKRNTGVSDRLEEVRLATLWWDAGMAVRRTYPKLSERCLLKSLNLNDPDGVHAKGTDISLADMQKALGELLAMEKRDAQKSPVPKWFPIAGVVFAGITVVFLMYLIVGPDLDPARRNILNLLMALAVAASAAFIGGEAAARGNIPGFSDSPIRFSAASGVGTFIVVYLILWYTR